MTGVLAAHRLGEGAAVGLCLDENGHMFLGINSNQVRGVASACSPVTASAANGCMLWQTCTENHSEPYPMPSQMLAWTVACSTIIHEAVCSKRGSACAGLLPTTLIHECITASGPAR